MLFRIATFSLALFLFAGCAQQDGDDAIKTPSNGGGGGGGSKPSNVLHRHVLLTLSGWADLRTLIEILNSPDSRLGCVSKSTTKITWNCPFAANGKSGRRGDAEISRQGGVITVSTSALGLFNQVRRGAHTLLGQQDYELTLVPIGSGYRFRYQASSEVPTGNSRASAHYRFDWDLSGTVAIQGTEWTITNGDGTLNVLKFARSGSGGKNLQFKMSSTESLAWQSCGAVNGKFWFSGDKQDLTTVNSDLVKGIRSEEGGKAYPWSECTTGPSGIYGLTMAAPFWEQPDP